ncbi:MFS transporter [Undibacterium flavidum]|uniref:MFS transporter n=1 Tax=Undibacterium flavidum TaxID=2762297 RepID=A0ABR6YE60_9BURK|nr:MFS transporter [Undibacterium flavidum]MBC3874846.1 MFS transporter [Undibacterium flavidum]
MNNSKLRHPLTWVPTLYFAEGLPLWVVLIVAGVMFKSMGISNQDIGHWTGILVLAWTFKPLWSPLLETSNNKRFFVVLFQIIGGIALGLIALTLQLPNSVAVTVALLGVVALASATHDIAADGLYIASLSTKQQTAFAGWQGAFYNASKFVISGGLVVLAGDLQTKYQYPPEKAWAVIFAIMSAGLIGIAIYHLWALPANPAVTTAPTSIKEGFATLIEVIIDFFKKPGIWLSILFILLFRAGEAQVSTIAPLFLLDSRAAGGLGLTTAQVGWAYGAAGTIAFIVGSIIGGYFAGWLGLRRGMVFLIIGMNMPNLAFFFLSSTMPDNLTIITAAIFIENFGFGFGFVGLILYMMQVLSVGKYQTAHYAFGTGFMALGLVLFRTFSGDIQAALGYKHFFLWVILSAIPVLVLSLWIVPKSTEEKLTADPALAV